MLRSSAVYIGAIVGDAGRLFSKLFATVNDLPSRTIQSAGDETDINKMMDRFALNGGLLPQITGVPMVEDFDSVVDFHTAMNVVVRSREAFMKLPADVRKRFGNDPRQFVEFVSERNEDGSLTNLVELRKLRVALPEVELPPEVIQKVEVVNGEKPA